MDALKNARAELEDISVDVSEAASAAAGLVQLARHDGGSVLGVASLLWHRLEAIAHEVGELHRKLEELEDGEVRQ